MRAGALAALVLLCGCRAPEPLSLHIAGSLEKLIPPDTMFLTGADLESLRGTTVYRKWLADLALPQLNEFSARTGVDPRKDLTEVLSCSDDKTAVLLARGSFQRKAIEQHLLDNGAARSLYRGSSIYANANWGVMFLNDAVGAAGTVPDLKAILDQRESGAHGPSPALRARVQAIPAGVQIWAAAVGGVPGLPSGVPTDSNLGNAIQLLQGIDAASAGLDLRNGLALKAEADCRTERDAQRIHDALRGLIGLGRLSTPDSQPELLKLYDAVKVTRQAGHVQVLADVPSDLVDRFLNLWLKRR